MKCERRSAARRSLRAASRCWRMRSASRRAKYSSSLRWRLLRCGMDPFLEALLIYTERVRFKAPACFPMGLPLGRARLLGGGWDDGGFVAAARAGGRGPE